MDIERLSKVLQSEAGRDLMEYIEERIRSLESIRNVEISLNPIKTAIAIRANFKAIEVLDEIYKFLTNNVRKVQPKDQRDNYY